MDKLINNEGRTVRVEDNYPYERLTPMDVANIQRLRDRQMRELRQESERLSRELYYAKKRLKEIMPILEELGIDIDVILATKKAFQEKPVSYECDMDYHAKGCQCPGR